MHPFIHTATKAARAAAKIIMQAQERPERLRISTKGENDLVTEADLASEREIIHHLQKAYPDHAILAEESGLHEGNSDYQWLIDPIDGTMNYAHGFPYYCISIACLHKGRVEHAVIYNPNNDDLFTASRGAGAQKNNRRIRVSACQQLDRAMIATGLPACAKALRKDYLHIMHQFSEQVGTLRRNGAAALDMAYVASGQLDGFWEMSLQPWDVAAGSLLIKEAGGIVSDFRGTDDYLQSGHIICAPPKVFRPLMDSLKPYLPESVR